MGAREALTAGKTASRRRGPSPRLALTAALNGAEPSAGLRVTRSWATGDLRAAGRRAGEPFTVTVTTDGGVAVHLRQLAPRSPVTLDGKRAGRADPRGHLTLRMGAGQHSVAL